MLFLVQDSDRPMYVVGADDMNEAVCLWRRQIQEENPDDDCSDDWPIGVQLLESDENSILSKTKNSPELPKLQAENERLKKWLRFKLQQYQKLGTAGAISTIEVMLTCNPPWDK